MIEDNDEDDHAETKFFDEVIVGQRRGTRSQMGGAMLTNNGGYGAEHPSKRRKHEDDDFRSESGIIHDTDPLGFAIGASAHLGAGGGNRVTRQRAQQ